MIEIEDNSKEQGTIVQEIQKGFLMKDRLLRPSLVGVSKKKSKKRKQKILKKTKNNEKFNFRISCRLKINTYMTIII